MPVGEHVGAELRTDLGALAAADPEPDQLADGRTEVDRLVGSQVTRHHHHERARAVLPHREQVDDPDDAQLLEAVELGQ